MRTGCSNIQTNGITLKDKTLTDESGRLVGWIADEGKFHPCGVSITPEQLRAILAMLLQAG